VQLTIVLFSCRLLLSGSGWLPENHFALHGESTDLHFQGFDHLKQFASPTLGHLAKGVCRVEF
jgi:hypothetical protein